MVKLVVLYGRPKDSDAFERYYADTHTALAKAVPGLRRFEAARGIATPDGTEVPYQRIAELTFDDGRFRRERCSEGVSFRARGGRRRRRRLSRPLRRVGGA